MKKRILASLAAVCLLAGMLSTAVLAADETDTSWYNSGEASFTITDAADLRGLAQLVNGGTNFSGKTVTMANAINCGGAALTPIGAIGKPFKGTFDGGGYAISNGTFTTTGDGLLAGMFGYVESGTVKNLTFTDIGVTNLSADGEESASGMAVARLKNGTVSGVTVGTGCTVTGSLRTGGVVGDARGTTPQITNCTNYATVTGSGSYTGGIVGATHELGLLAGASIVAARIELCENHGSIHGTSEVGGIAGYADRASISNCHNYAAVTGTGNYGTGGILGCDIYNKGGLFAPKKGSTITGCTNTGAVSAPRAGGILGSFVAAPGDKQPTSAIYSVLTNCTNSGAITGTAGKCGVIFGYQITYAQGDGDTSINNLMVKMVSCTIGGTVNGETVNVGSPSKFIVVSSS